MSRKVNLAAAAGVCVISTVSSHAVLSVFPTEFWKFDDNYNAQVDNVANVGVPQVNNGGAVSFVPGKFGSAIDLESTGAANAWVSVADADNTFDMDNDIGTFSIWFQLEQYDIAWQALLGGGEGNAFRIHRNNAAAELQINMANGPVLNTPVGSVPINTWHHLAFSNNAAAGTQVWYNGVRTANATARNTTGNALPFAIGNNPGGLARAWDGKIDDVAFWNVALTDADVQQIWNGGAGRSIASLIPEPSGVALIGLVGFGMILRRRR